MRLLAGQRAVIVEGSHPVSYGESARSLGDLLQKGDHCPPRGAVPPGGQAHLPLLRIGHARSSYRASGFKYRAGTRRSSGSGGSTTLPPTAARSPARHARHAAVLGPPPDHPHADVPEPARPSAIHNGSIPVASRCSPSSHASAAYRSCLSGCSSSAYRSNMSTDTRLSVDDHEIRDRQHSE